MKQCSYLLKQEVLWSHRGGFVPIFKSNERLHSKQFKLYNHFNNDGSVLERKGRRPQSVSSPENTDAVRVALQGSPNKSTRKAAAQRGISRRSVQRILRSYLNLYQRKITVLPKFTVQNKHQRIAFAEWAQKNEVSFKNVWFSDEAQFHLDGVVNKQNVRFWPSENPRVSSESASCTENYSVGRHLKSWTTRANFL
jgi:hypothetical protein